MPSQDILRLYRKAGGEIITMGSTLMMLKRRSRNTGGMPDAQGRGLQILHHIQERKPEFIRL